MWITRHFASRTLIWLAAIAVPGQMLPTPSCQCSGSKACCRESEHSQHCCGAIEKSRAGGCCRSQEIAAGRHSCCGRSHGEQESQCWCGVDCTCREVQQPAPAQRPVQDSSTAKVVDGAVSTPAVVTDDSQGHLIGRVGRSLGSAAPTAQDRCVGLCRLTL